MDAAARLLFAGLVAGPHRILPRATTSTSDSLMREAPGQQGNLIVVALAAREPSIQSAGPTFAGTDQ
jgi:hypothetical protein